MRFRATWMFVGGLGLAGVIFVAHERMVNAGRPDMPTVLASPREGVEITRRASQPNMITYKDYSDRTRLHAAAAEAQAHLDYFWGHYQRPERGERKFTIKVRFVVTRDGENGTESIWVRDFARAGDTFIGVLDNEPDVMADKHSGDQVEFTRTMIEDWGFQRQGKIIGFYTTRAMLDDTDPAEAAQIKSMLGENPA